MKQYLVQIEQMLNRNGGLMTYEGLSSECVMNAPASEHEINNCKQSLSKEIPQQYIHFLNAYNGGTVFKIEDFAGYRLFSTQEIIKENAFQKENFGSNWDESIVLFCSCLGDNEYLGFKIHEDMYDIVDCVMDVVPKAWEVIGSNFDDLIQKLIKEKGKKYWLNNSSKL